MPDLAYGAVIGTCSALVVVIWLSAIERENQKTVSISQGLLRVSPAYKRFTTALMLLFAIAVLYIFQLDELDRIESLVLYVFGITCTGFALQMFADTFFLGIRFDKIGIAGCDRFHRKNSIEWANIESVKFDATFNVFTVKGNQKKIRFSRFCVGIYPLLREFEARTPVAPAIFVSDFLKKNSRE